MICWKLLTQPGFFFIIEIVSHPYRSRPRGGGELGFKTMPECLKCKMTEMKCARHNDIEMKRYASQSFSPDVTATLYCI